VRPDGLIALGLWTVNGTASSWCDGHERRGAHAILALPFIMNTPHMMGLTPTGLQLFQAGPAHTVSTQTLCRLGSGCASLTTGATWGAPDGERRGTSAGVGLRAEGLGGFGGGGTGCRGVRLLVAGDGGDCGGRGGLAGEDSRGGGSMLLPWPCRAEAATMI
jgi:hypothetical protein